MRSTKIGDVKDYLNKNIAPMAWQRIQIRLLPNFKEKGFYFHTMTDDKELDQDLIRSINTAIEELYSSSLPAEFLN